MLYNMENLLFRDLRIDQNPSRLRNYVFNNSLKENKSYGTFVVM
jgi:hypothetical protein